jgi:hypothetical protein
MIEDEPIALATTEERLLRRIEIALQACSDLSSVELTLSGEGVPELNVEYEGEWFTLSIY